MLPPLDDIRPHIGWLNYGMSEGFIHCRCVAIDGRAVANVFVSVGHGPDATLHINGITALCRTSPFAATVEALRIIAKEFNCNVIQAETRRHGMATILEKFGFVPTSVVLRRAI